MLTVFSIGKTIIGNVCRIVKAILIKMQNLQIPLKFLKIDKNIYLY